MLTIDIDTGGTFTDGTIQTDDYTVLLKVDTTPHDPVLCFVECIEQGAKQLGLSLDELIRQANMVRYSTTIATNALLQRDGDRVGLIVDRVEVEPVRNQLETGEGQLGRVLNKDMICGVQTQPDLDERELATAVRTLLRGGARILAVAFDGAWQTPILERRARSLIRASYPRHYLGAVPVILSSDVAVSGPADEARNAALVNAYIHRLMARYLYRADEEIRGRDDRQSLYIVHANGGVARVPKTLAIHTYNSGPAAGIHGGWSLTREYGLDGAVLLDVGGTSADLSIVGADEPVAELPADIEGLHAAVPLVQVDSLGGGGGSIIRPDGDGGVTVGPDSAGAVPGPASYGLGGLEATITDANVLCGHINPDYFFGGRRRLDVERAQAALQGVADEVGSGDAMAIAAAACDRLHTHIAQQISESAARDGRDPAKLPLVAFGGAGPMHAAFVARHLGISKVLIPGAAPTFSAWGASRMDLRLSYEKYITGPRTGIEEELKDACLRDFRDSGIPAEHVSFEWYWCGADQGAFESIAVEDFARRGRGEGVLRLVGTSPSPHGIPSYVDSRGSSEGKPTADRRQITWPGGQQRTSAALFHQGGLPVGERIADSEGCVIESDYTLILAPPGMQVQRDELGTVALTEGRP